MSSPEPARHRGFDTRLAAYCVVVRESRILLALWDMRASAPDFLPRWTLPGGGVELGEAIEDAAVREVAEETGYDVRLSGLLGVDSGHVPPELRLHGAARPLQTVAVVYGAEIVGGVLANESDGTTTEAAWFDLADVARLERTTRVDHALGLFHAKQQEGAV
ncbi:NUDIX hydrolase [Arthrobacter sp. KK5.5]|uniref:NUDIX hydrolase n=1 Tax=Arthrobacter sp. KK5.5 TaxID=3373084 RepID=UPI003EE7DB46